MWRRLSLGGESGVRRMSRSQPVRSPESLPSTSIPGMAVTNHSGNLWNGSVRFLSLKKPQLAEVVCISCFSILAERFTISNRFSPASISRETAVTSSPHLRCTVPDINIIRSSPVIRGASPRQSFHHPGSTGCGRKDVIEKYRSRGIEEVEESQNPRKRRQLLRSSPFLSDRLRSTKTST